MGNRRRSRAVAGGAGRPQAEPGRSGRSRPDCLRALSVAGGSGRSRPDVCGPSVLRADLVDRDRIVCGRSALRADLVGRDRMFAGAQRCGRTWPVATGCLRALSVAGGPGRSRPDICGRSGAELLGAAAGRVGVLRGRFQVRADLDELVQSWSIADGVGRSRPLPSPCRAIAAAPIAVPGGRGRFLTVGDQVRSIATVFLGEFTLR
ncbi:hypothetical protein OROMI_024035 [Orobanche minor]